MGLEEVLRLISTEYKSFAILILFFSSMIEYVFPPFPGDTVTIAGAVLVGFAGFNLFYVFGAVTLGSLIGSILVYYFGIYIYNYQKKKKSKTLEEKLDFVISKFKKHGAVYLVLNRFFPGIRSLFFVAAGMSKIPLKKVILFSFISLTLWNILLVSVGIVIGYNIPALENFFKTYTTVVWLLILLIFAFYAFKLLKKKKS